MLPRSIGTPFCHTTACLALTLPTATPQVPEIPTTWPRSLIAVAALVESPGSGGGSLIPPSSSQINARNCRAGRALLHLGSATPSSAPPLISTPPFTAPPYLLNPPPNH